MTMYTSFTSVFAMCVLCMSYIYFFDDCLVNIKEINADQNCLKFSVYSFLLINVYMGGHILIMRVLPY